MSVLQCVACVAVCCMCCSVVRVRSKMKSHIATQRSNAAHRMKVFHPPYSFVLRNAHTQTHALPFFTANVFLCISLSPCLLIFFVSLSLSPSQLMCMYVYVHLCIYIHTYICTSAYVRKIQNEKSHCNTTFQCGTERWGAGVETQKNVRGEIGGWGRVPFHETYAPSLSTIYDGA